MKAQGLLTTRIGFYLKQNAEYEVSVVVLYRITSFALCWKQNAEYEALTCACVYVVEVSLSLSISVAVNTFLVAGTHFCGTVV